MPKDNEATIAIMLRVEPAMVDAIDNWRREQPDLPTRPEAIRRMIAQATARKGGKPGPK